MSPHPTPVNNSRVSETSPGDPGFSHQSIPVRISYHRQHSSLRHRCDTSNLISIRTLPPFPQRHTSQLSFRYLNARNLMSKSAHFLDHIHVHSPDIVAITETWFKPRDAAARSECTPPGYKLLDQARPSLRQGGGTALVFRDCFSTKSNSSGEKIFRIL